MIYELSDTNHIDEIKQMTCIMNSHIHKIVNGKITPEIGSVYLNIMSRSIDQIYILFEYLQNILDQNEFNPMFRIIIGLNNNIDTKMDTKMDNKIDNIINIEYMIPKKLKNNIYVCDSYDDYLKQNKKILKPSIIICKLSQISDYVKEFNPDLILIDEIKYKKIGKKEHQIYDSLCNLSYLYSIVSFTKYINTTDISDIITDNLKICYKYKNLSEQLNNKKLSIGFKFVSQETIADPELVIKLISEQSINYTDKNKKFLVITNHKKIIKLFNKLSNKSTINSSYHGLIDIRAYDASNEKDLNDFLKLYTHDSTDLDIQFLSKGKRSKYLNHINAIHSENGILFMDINQFNQMYDKNILHILRNVNNIMMLNDMIRENTEKYNALMMLLMSNNYKISKNITFIEPEEKYLYKQLFRISNIIYPESLTNIEKFQNICQMIKNNNIISNVIFDHKIKQKLEKMFKITESDKRFYNRNNTIYIVTISKTNSTIKEYYENEKEYLRSSLTIDDLTKEFEQIIKPKSLSKTYSGAKWLGTKRQNEISGNMIGFLHQRKQIIEICQIIDVHKFSRKFKRPIWKEKENKDKNILFLSPIINTIRLSELIQSQNINKTYDFENMEEFIIQ